MKAKSIRWTLVAILSVIFAVAISFGGFLTVENQSKALADGTSTSVAKIGDVEYNSFESAFGAAQDGQTITIVKDFDLTWNNTTFVSGNTYGAYVLVGKSITIDLNGKDVTVDNDKYTGDYNFGIIVARNGGKLTLKDSGETGSISASGTSQLKQPISLLWAVDSTSSITVESGSYYLKAAKDSLIRAGATNTITINGGNFTLENVGSEGGSSNYKPWIFNVDGDNEGYVTVNGGTFNYDIQHQYFYEEVKISTGKGLKSNGNGTWTVGPAVASVAEGGRTIYYADLQQAIVAAAPAGTVEIVADVTVNKWIMFSETLTIGNGEIITIDINGLTINGNGKTLTIKDIESAGNGARLFYDATKLNVNNLTIKCVEGIANAGGIALTSGTIENVTFIGGKNAIFPGTGNVTITGCTFETNGQAIYYEAARDNLTVSGNTFDTADGKYAIILRGTETFTGNTITTGKVNVAGGSPVVTGNDFGTERFKVYNNATATISNNKINTIEFSSTDSKANSTFTGNTLSETASNAITVATTVAQIGTTNYSTLESAINSALEGQTVTLIKNVTETVKINNTANITIDMNGKILDGYFAPFAGNVTLKNGTIVNETGSVSAIEITSGSLVLDNMNISSARHAIRVDGTVDVTIESGNYSLISAKGRTQHVLNVTGNSTVTINGGTFTGPKGTVSDSGAVLNIRDTSKAIVTGGNFSGGKTKTISGAGTITITGGTYDQDPSAYVADGYGVAKLNSTYYISLQDAINAAQVGDTITIIKDYELTSGVVISADDEIILNLNGKTISYDSSIAGEDMVTNCGKLTINDSVGNGKITYNNTDSTATNVTVSTISTVAGSSLVINGGIIENKTVKADGSSIYPFTIDILTNGNLGDVTVTIEGGEIKSDYIAIRQFNNGTACKNTLTVNAGYIYGAKRAIQIHMDNTAAYTTIAGGKIEGGDYALCFFANSENIAVTGGTFSGSVYSKAEGIISGGTFDEEVYSAYCKEDFATFENTDGSYTVKEIPPVVVVCKDGYEKEFKTLAAAMSFGYSGGIEKIVINRDITESMGYLKGNLVCGKYGNVIIKNTIKDEWIYCDYSNFTIGEGITYDATGEASGLFVYGDNCIIKGDVIVDCYYQRYAGSKLTIENGSLTVKTETFILRYTDNDPNAGIYVIGDNDDSTVELNANVIYFYQGMINAKDATIKVGTYWQTQETDNQGFANLVLDNSKMTVTVDEHPAKATGVSTVTLTNDSSITCADGFLMSTTTTVSVDATSSIVVSNAVAKIGGVHYKTLAAALAAAQNNETITLIDGNAPIAMNGAVYGKTVTITGTATVDWSKGFLFVGRGGAGNGTVIFENANLTSASNSSSYGIHVSGREKNTNNKYDGTLIIKNSTIELDYLINKGTMTLDNSTLTVKNGFSIGGRPASETESGVDATATIDITKGSKVVVNNHNGMGLGYEAIGSMEVDKTSTFETTQSFLVTAKGTLNLAGTAKIAGTLTNNGSIVITDAGATLISSTCENVTTNIDGKVAIYDGEKYRVVEIATGVLYVNSNYTGNSIELGNGKYFGYNAFNSLEDIADKILTDGSNTIVKIESDLEVSSSIVFKYGTGDIIFEADNPVTIKQTTYGLDFDFTQAYDCNIIVNENVTFEIYDNNSGWYMYYGPSLNLSGTITGGQSWGCLYLFNGSHTVNETGVISVGRLHLGYTEILTKGEIDTNYLLVEHSEFKANGATIEAGIIYDNNNGGQRWGASSFEFINSTVNAESLTLSYADSTMLIDQGSEVTVKTMIIAGRVTVKGKLNVETLTIKDGGQLIVEGGTVVSATTVNNGSIILASPTATLESNECGNVTTDIIGYVVGYDGKKYFINIPVAKVGNKEYASIDEAIAAWTNGTTLTLLADVTLSDVVTLKSTEHHILNLGTYTMTAASGKNAFVIKACGTGDSERTAITINADATNPGGINAGSKSVVYYKYADGGITGNDRPIIKINGGVFTGSTSSFGTAGIYTIGTAARKCATLNISGGTFNCSINGSGKSKLVISGGTFNYSVGSQGDSTALRLISGGTFKTLGFMTADSNNTKFWIGTSMGNSNVGVHVDDNGYIVVGGPVVTEAGETFEASSTNYSGASSYLQYSSAKDNGLYYTSVKEALADNNTTSGKVTVYVDELDLTGSTYKGTIVIPEGKEGVSITYAEGTTPAWNVAAAGNQGVDYTEAIVDGVVTRVYKTGVAKIGTTYYETLAEAIAAAKDGDTITILACTLEEGTIKLPTTLTNVTIKGADNHTSILKDMTIMSADGNSYAYDDITFDGIVFDNSNIVITGWRSGSATAKNITVNNCIFKNIVNSSNNAAVHINVEADEAVENFTFTNNVIDGATGGSKSGIYGQFTGKVVVKNNVINNVAFRPYVIQLTSDDGIVDTLTVEGNTFSGSAVGRAQALTNNAAGTDTITLTVTGNIFKGITGAQQICYWNFNEETTTADFSKNYYDVNVVENANRFYFNGAASTAKDLVEIGIFPIYTKLNSDGTIDENSLEDAYKSIQVVYTDGTVEYFDDILKAVPYTTNYPKLEGATITLLKDISGAGIRMMENGMVLDLNGHTYTIIAGTGSQGTNTSGFQIRPEVTDTAIIKNGTIKVAEGAPVVWMFNVYATNFIVEDVTVDCTNMAYSYGESVYAHVSRPGDNTEFKGNTKFINFDSSKAGNIINVGGTMTIGENVVVGGTIELDAGATLTAPAGLDVVTTDGYKVVYNNGSYSTILIVATIGTVGYGTFEEALNAVQNGETITILNVTGSEINTEIEFTRAISFTITGYAPNYALPVITFQNETDKITVTIKDAEILIPELDARKNATINVVNSTVHDAGGNSIIKSYYNGAINISNSTVYTMQVTTMGYINVTNGSIVNATWQTNVFGNGIITVSGGATFNTASLQLTGKDYSGRDNTDADRVGKPATIIVDGATLTVGKVYSDNGADYSYNSSKGINIGTIAGKSAVLDIKNGATVNILMANGETANVGADGIVNVDGTVTVSCRSTSGTVELVNNGSIVLTTTTATLTSNKSGKVETTVGGKVVVYDGEKYRVVDIETGVLYVNANYTGDIIDLGNGKYFGYNAFNSLEDIADKILTDGNNTIINIESDLEVSSSIEFLYGTGDIIFNADKPVTIKQTTYSLDFAFTTSKACEVIVNENITFEIYDNNSGIYMYYGPSFDISGTITGGQSWGCLYLFNGSHTVNETGVISVGRLHLGYTEILTKGEIDTNYLLVEHSEFKANGATIDAGVIYDNNNGGQRWGASSFEFINSTVNANRLTLSYADSTMLIDKDSIVTVGEMIIAGRVTVKGELNVETLTIKDGGQLIVEGGTIKVAGTLTNNGTINVTGQSNVSGAFAGDGWIYMSNVTLDADTVITNAKVLFASGTNNITGSTITGRYFNVGYGKDEFVTDGLVDTTNGVIVNVKGGAKIGSTGNAYTGWIGSKYGNANLTGAKYVLNVENSLATFGYLHISIDGELNVTGTSTEKYKDGATEVSFYAGDFIVNGVANFNDTSAWAKYTKVSFDNATANGGKLVINNSTYEASIHNGSTTKSTLILKNNAVVEINNSTVEIDNETSIANGSTITVDGSSVTAKGTITNNGNVVLKSINATFASDECGNVTTVVDDYVVVYENGMYKLGLVVVEVNGKGYAYLQTALNDAITAGDNVTVTLLYDIDLTGKSWTPVYFNSYASNGANTLVIDGNGKIITGLTDMLFSSIWTGTKFEVKNLTIKGATIKHDVNDTENIGVGAIVGNVSAIKEVVIDNVNITNSHVEGGHWTGAFFGYIAGYSGNDGPVFTTVSITNSSVTNSTITGKGSVGGVVGHATGDPWTSFGIETSTITGNTITSTGSSTNKAGIVAGTIGAAGTAQTTNGTTLTGGVAVSVNENNNTATSNGTVITTVYGRQGSTTGKLTITGGTYTNNPIEEGVSYAGPAEGKAIANMNGTYGLVKADRTYEVGAGKTFATIKDAIAQAKADYVVNATFKIYGAIELETGFSHGIVDFGAKSNVIIEGADVNAKLTIVGGGVPDIKGITLKNIKFADEGTYLTTANEFMYQNFIDTTFESVVFEDGIRLSGNCTITNCTVNANTTNEYAIWFDNGEFTIIGSTIVVEKDAYGMIKSDEADKITLTNNTFKYLGTANKEALNTKGATIIASGNTFVDCIQGIVPADKTNYTDNGTVITDTIIDANNEIIINVAIVNGVRYQTLAEAFAVAQNNDEVKIILAGTYALSTSGKNITITGAVDGVVFDNIGAKNMGGANVTFNNVTFDYYPNTNYTGLQHSGNLVYNDCTFNGQVFLYGASETFNNCTFNQNSADAYNVWTYGANKVAFNNCTFNSVGKSVLVYSETTDLYNEVTVTDSDFIASAPADGKAAIEIDTSLTSGATITIDSATTATGFGSGNVSGNSLWNNKKGSNTDATNDLTVVVDGTTILAPVTFVAKIGEIGYTSINEAIAAAQAGETVTILAGTYNQGLTINKAITVVGETGANGELLVTFNGKVSISGSNIAVKNINVFNGSGNAMVITGGNILVENCDITGANALRNCYANNGNVILKNCDIVGGTYGVHFDGGKGTGSVIIEGGSIAGWTSFGAAVESVSITGTEFKYGNQNQLRFYQDVTVTNTKFNPNMTIDFGKNEVKADFTGSSVTDGSPLTDVIYLADIAEMGVEIKVDNAEIRVPAKIGRTYYLSLADALNAAQDGAIIELIWKEGDAPIAMNGAVYGKTVTITGTATVDWSKGFLFVGRGGAGNGTVIFDNANLTSASNNASYGIHVSGREKNTNNKYDGTLIIKNSTIVLDYLINKGTMTLDNSTLTVKNGFSIGGRPASETESGVDATATISLTNGSKVVVNNHNGMGLGYEAIGVMNVDATSTFETTQSFLVTAKGTLNLAGTAKIVGTLTNNGSIVLTTTTATLTSSECGNVTSGDEDYVVVYRNGAYKLALAIAKVGNTCYADLHEAMVACKSGETVELLTDVDLSGTTWEPVSFKGTFNGNGFTISNLTINKPGVSNVGFITSLNGKFGNVTFTNPTVIGGENTGIVAGRTGGSAAYAHDITINGTIKVETTHRGYARTGGIVGGWAYGKYENITIDGGDKAISYIKHTGGGDGRYVAGIVGHADDVDAYINCTVKNITISGGWLCGGIAGPGPASTVTSGCAVENINVNADYSGGMFGWYHGNGTIENSSIKDVTFTAGNTNNGAIGGYSNNTSANISNVTITNVKNHDGTPLLSDEAKIGNVGYAKLNDAIKAAITGDEITIINNITLTAKDLTVIDGRYNTFFLVEGKKVTINLNGYKITGEKVALTKSMLVGVFSTDNSGHLVLNGEVAGSEVSYTAGTTTVYSLIVNYEGGCSITINGGNYTLDKASDSLIYSGTDQGENEGIIVNSGNFYLGNVGTGTNGKPWIFNCLDGNERNVVVNGGTFNFDVNHQHWAEEVYVDKTLALKNIGTDTNNITWWTVVDAVAYAEEGNRNVGYASLNEAINGVTDGKSITVLKDITLTTEDLTVLGNSYDTFFLVDGKTVTINLNGYNITGNAVELTKSMLVSVFSTDNNGHLTINGEGSTVSYTAGTTKVYSLIANYKPGCSITINGGNYTLDKASDSLIYSGADEGIIVNSGNFYLGNTGKGPDGNESPWIFNVKGQDAGNVIVNGGTFNTDINHQYYSCEVYVPETKALKANGNGTWTVTKAVAYVIETSRFSGSSRNVGYATFDEALEVAKDGKTLVLLETVKVTKDTSYDLGAAIIKTDAAAANVYMDAFRVYGGATLTIKGDGTVDATPSEGYAFYVGEKNGTESANLVIEGGKFYGSTTVAQATYGTITINGGYFEATEYNGAYDFTLNCWDTNYNAEERKAQIVVNGGTFKNYNPQNNAAEGASTNFCGKGYGSVATDSTTYSVVKFFEAFHMTLSEGIAVTYHVNLDPAQVATAKMVFTLKGDETTVKTGSDKVDSTGDYLFEYSHINPACMTDTIYAKLYLGDNLVATYEYSIEEYCYTALGKTQAELGYSDAKYAAYRDLVADLLNYGAAAQVYKAERDSDYSAEVLPNRNLPQGLGTQFVKPISDDIERIESSTSFGIKTYGATIYYDKSVSIRLYFEIIEQNIDLTGKYVMVYKNGVLEKQGYLTDPKICVKSGNKFYVQTSNIAADKMDTIYTVSILSSPSFDAFANACSYTYSIKSAVFNNAETQSSYGKLVRALWSYGQSADIYVHL